MEILDVNNKFLTNKGSKQVAHYRTNTFVAICMIVLNHKGYCLICKEFVQVALVH